MTERDTSNDQPVAYLATLRFAVETGKMTIGDALEAACLVGRIGAADHKASTSRLERRAGTTAIDGVSLDAYEIRFGAVEDGPSIAGILRSKEVREVRDYLLGYGDGRRAGAEERATSDAFPGSHIQAGQACAKCGIAWDSRVGDCPGRASGEAQADDLHDRCRQWLHRNAGGTYIDNDHHALRLTQFVRAERDSEAARPDVDCTECNSVGLGNHKRCADDATRTCPRYAEYRDAKRGSAEASQVEGLYHAIWQTMFGWATNPVSPAGADLRASHADEMTSVVERLLQRRESPSPCRVPPPGWSCSRAGGHEGPCAASAVTADAARSDAPASVGPGDASRSPSAPFSSGPAPRAEGGQRIESAGPNASVACECICGPDEQNEWCHMHGRLDELAWELERYRAAERERNVHPDAFEGRFSRTGPSSGVADHEAERRWLRERAARFYVKNLSAAYDDWIGNDEHEARRHVSEDVLDLYELLRTVRFTRADQFTRPAPKEET